MSLAQYLYPRGFNILILLSYTLITQKLYSRGLLDALSRLIKHPKTEARQAAAELFVRTLTHNPVNVRQYIIKQFEQNARTPLIQTAIRSFIAENDDGTKTLCGECLRIVLDTDTMQGEKFQFLNRFYDKSFAELIAPLVSVPDDPMAHREYVSNKHNTLYSIMELLTSQVLNHATFIKPQLLRNSLIHKLTSLLSDHYTYLSLGVVRFIRSLLSLGDEPILLCMQKRGVFGAVLNAYVTNGLRYNMLDSAIAELLGYVKGENMKTTIKYIVDHHRATIEKFKDQVAFKGLLQKYEQNEEIMSLNPNRGDGAADSIAQQLSSRFRPDARQLDAEEADYFDDDDDDVIEPTLDMELDMDIDMTMNLNMNVNVAAGGSVPTGSDHTLDISMGNHSSSGAAALGGTGTTSQPGRTTNTTNTTNTTSATVGSLTGASVGDSDETLTELDAQAVKEVKERLRHSVYCDTTEENGGMSSSTSSYTTNQGKGETQLSLGMGKVSPFETYTHSSLSAKTSAQSLLERFTGVSDRASAATTTTTTSADTTSDDTPGGARGSTGMISGAKTDTATGKECDATTANTHTSTSTGTVTQPDTKTADTDTTLNIHTGLAPTFRALSTVETPTGDAVLLNTQTSNCGTTKGSETRDTQTASSLSRLNDAVTTGDGQRTADGRSIGTLATNGGHLASGVDTRVGRTSGEQTARIETHSAQRTPSPAPAQVSLESQTKAFLDSQRTGDTHGTIATAESANTPGAIANTASTTNTAGTGSTVNIGNTTRDTDWVRAEERPTTAEHTRTGAEKANESKGVVAGDRSKQGAESSRQTVSNRQSVDSRRPIDSIKQGTEGNRLVESTRLGVTSGRSVGSNKQDTEGDKPMDSNKQGVHSSRPNGPGVVRPERKTPRRPRWDVKGPEAAYTEKKHGVYTRGDSSVPQSRDSTQVHLRADGVAEDRVQQRSIATPSQSSESKDRGEDGLRQVGSAGTSEKSTYKEIDAPRKQPPALGTTTGRTTHVKTVIETGKEARDKDQIMSTTSIASATTGHPNQTGSVNGSIAYTSGVPMPTETAGVGKNTAGSGLGSGVRGGKGGGDKEPENTTRTTRTTSNVAASDTRISKGVDDIGPENTANTTNTTSNIGTTRRNPESDPSRSAGDVPFRKRVQVDKKEVNALSAYRDANNSSPTKRQRLES